MKSPKLWRSLRKAAKPGRAFIERAAVARGNGHYRDAATLYAEALKSDPRNGPLHVQAGHMFKEARAFGQAEQHYRRAMELMPCDADLALQLGHFHQTLGRLAEAREEYDRAKRLAPDWDEPTKEIERLHRAGWRAPGETMDVIAPDETFARDEGRVPYDPKIATSYGTMAPEQLPRPFRQLLRRSEPSINIVQFGVMMNTFWGTMRVVRGVEALRGFSISTEPLIEVTAVVNGIPIHVGPLKGPYELQYEPDQQRIHKYVYNIWYDFSSFAPGRYRLELRFRDLASALRTWVEDFVIESPLLESDHPESDAIINLAPGDARSIEEQIAARPSMAHEASRTDRHGDVRNIMVMRPDQLGDLVASIPGIKRLREIFPAARVIGVMSPANVDFARTLGLFDGIVVVDLRESMELRTRTIGWEKQEELREQLSRYDFDLAIDLSQSLMSRPLLALSGAPFLYGFKDAAWPRLTASVDDAFVDPKNHRERATHSIRIVAMIERLAALFGGSAQIVRREDLSRERLARFRIAEGERYAVLHMGARIVFSRWPHFPALAERLHRDTDLKIVIFSNGTDVQAALPAEMAASDRFVVIDQQLPFDDFDAMLSFCSVYVGNDSGPKHLASLRGVPVVSIHSVRVSWSEWGQEQTGVVLTRKLPCAGCSIYHDVDECGKDFVCISAITLDHVYEAVRRYV